MTKNHGCATLERDHSAQLFILCGLLLATSHHTRVVHDHNLLAGHRHMRRSGPSCLCASLKTMFVALWTRRYVFGTIQCETAGCVLLLGCVLVVWQLGISTQLSRSYPGRRQQPLSECGHFWLFGRWTLARTCGVSVECSDLTCDANTLGCRVWCAETWSVGILPFKSIPHVSACPVCPLSGRGW